LCSSFIAPHACIQRLIDVLEDVLDVFDADGQADTKSGVTPVALCSSSESCWWVVDAGWIARVLASPTLARWEINFSELMNSSACLHAPLDPETEDGPGASRKILCARSRSGLDESPG
jgi:hypothetical protein